MAASLNRSRIQANVTGEKPQCFDPDYAVTHQDIAILGPNWEADDASVSMGVGCGELSTADGIDNGVEIGGNPHYFTLSGCQETIRRERARRRWMPPGHDDEDNVLAGMFGPGVGGC
jgi:hypothetical protein